MTSAPFPAQPSGATGVVVLDDGSVLWGHGFGKVGHGVGEICFNTAMTGYQEVLTDPSYAGQIITFTFPHIGNVGTNADDRERDTAAAVGAIVRELPTAPSNFRNQQPLPAWMADRGLIGLAGIDTRALTRRIREQGPARVAIAHAPDGVFDLDALLAAARSWPGLEGLDLARDVSREDTGGWEGGAWSLAEGYAHSQQRRASDGLPHVVAVDYGAKDTIFRNLIRAGARVTVVPAQTSADAILALNPDGVFLSNGPGDPAATGAYAVPTIRTLLNRNVPIFGICLGHQLLALAAGAQTTKMHQGHRGANHPVRRSDDGRVEITSMNHGFAVDASTLPDGVVETHRSLFDGSNCGIAIPGKNAFSVQYHPEASPGPQDSFYLFEKFVGGLQA